jgi:hypothetical protein
VDLHCGEHLNNLDWHKEIEIGMLGMTMGYDGDHRSWEEGTSKEDDGGRPGQRTRRAGSHQATMNWQDSKFRCTSSTDSLHYYDYRIADSMGLSWML